MYECCCAKRFFKLVLLDIIIFSVCLIFFLIGKTIVFSASPNNDEEVFLPVIMYHSICENNPHDYSVTPEQVESDLAYLKNNGYTAVTAQQLADYVYNDGFLPAKPVLITLDDGFYNNLYYLLPLLEKYDMNAVISIVGNFIDNNAEENPHVPEYSYLTWDDVNELLRSNRIEIGNHTYNMHSNNSRKGCSIYSGENPESYADIFNDDISLLQSEIHEHTGTIPFIFAYPYGYICSESIPVLRENGFLITLTCRERPNYINHDPDCLYGLGRYNRSGNISTEEFMEKILNK